MCVGSRVLSQLWHLSRASSRQIIEHHDLPVPMPDGVALLTDRYYPSGGENLPVILIRSPYGRDYQFRDLAIMFGKRGFQVLL